MLGGELRRVAEIAFTIASGAQSGAVGFGAAQLHGTLLEEGGVWRLKGQVNGGGFMAKSARVDVRLDATWMTGEITLAFESDCSPLSTTASLARS